MVRSCILIYIIYAVWMGGAGGLGMGCQWLAGLDGRGWGVGDGLPMVSRVSL